MEFPKRKVDQFSVSILIGRSVNLRDLSADSLFMPTCRVKGTMNVTSTNGAWLPALGRPQRRNALSAFSALLLTSACAAGQR